MLKVKKGVVFGEFRWTIVILITVLRGVSKQLNKDIVITSASDGKHRKDSYHYKNLALDIRRWGWNKDGLGELIKMIKNQLKAYAPNHCQYYDIVLEKTHIHIEFDERRYLKSLEG